MPEELDKLAEGIGKAIKTVPDLYDDAVSRAIIKGEQIIAQQHKTDLK